MGFIEEIRQKEANKEQREAQLRAGQAAREVKWLQNANRENERCAQRRKQAEKFRQESGVGLAIDELIAFLEIPTIPVVRSRDNDGFTESYTEYVGRGTRGLPRPPVVRINDSFQDSYSRGIDEVDLQQRDPESVLDIVHWDVVSRGQKSVYGSYSTEDSYKYIAAESCPDGTFIFHGGFLASTTKRLNEWRTRDREQIIAAALAKAFEHPRIHRYKVSHYVSQGS
ncbi:MAG: hypothetical protein G01um10145_291 [Microgenomates group bacterium Gr01-1014_5]|nr:MAG: hypothetical protein G01um10145_291 [Microgenomates group bacterium Gr01-1014_5]